MLCARGPRLAPLALLLGACAGEVLPGDYFTVDVTTLNDGCNADEVSFSGTFEYRLVADEGNVTVYMGEDVLATGTWDGCNLAYQSPVFTERREGQDYIDWNLVGEAKAAAEGSLCDGSGDGWEGRETIQIVESTEDGIEPGCAYQMEATGVFVKSEGG